MTAPTDALIERLTPGAKRALLAMTGEWQFCCKATFDANGAHNLFWKCGGYRNNPYVEAEARKDGKWSRTAYRLTSDGLALRAAAQWQAGQEGEG